MFRLTFLALCVTALMMSACGGEMEAPEPEPMSWPEVAGYALMEIPPDNAMTAAKVALGKQLYYDRRLSGDGERSCYGCHLKENGLTDGRPTALGAFDKQLTRAAPTMWNVGYYESLYWDGRSGALEKQVKGAWGGGNMGASGNDGAPSMDDVCAKLNEIPGYASSFRRFSADRRRPTMSPTRLRPSCAPSSPPRKTLASSLSATAPRTL